MLTSVCLQVVADIVEVSLHHFVDLLDLDLAFGDTAHVALVFPLLHT
ncbi:MAG TPA: hypothetical protein VLH80_07380 [Nitrospiraceae bacterium]|nr:hypothetical protein [Nitrospiraceae bacterium]